MGQGQTKVSSGLQKGRGLRFEEGYAEATVASSTLLTSVVTFGAGALKGTRNTPAKVSGQGRAEKEVRAGPCTVGRISGIAIPEEKGVLRGL